MKFLAIANDAPTGVLSFWQNYKVGQEYLVKVVGKPLETYHVSQGNEHIPLPKKTPRINSYRCRGCV